MKKNTVLPMNVNPGFVPRSFMKCLSRSHKALSNLLEIQEESSAIPNLARTKNGRAFLESDAEWALLLDSDMTWQPVSIIQLLKTAKQQKAKVVSGITFMEQTQGRITPHAYEMVTYKEGEKKLMPYARLPSYTQPFTVTAVGGACLLVHRDVYEDVKRMQEGKTKFYWQQDIYLESADDMQGEDITFSKRIGEAGYEIWYDPRAPFPHLQKPNLITVQSHLEFLRSQGIDVPLDLLQ